MGQSHQDGKRKAILNDQSWHQEVIEHISVFGAFFSQDRVSLVMVPHEIFVALNFVFQGCDLVLI